MSFSVCVVTSVFNKEDSLDRFFDSLDYPFIYIVVIDDGSTDNSFEIINTRANHSRNIIHYKLEENVGVGKARNEGLKLIPDCCKYIYFLDADDWLDSNFLHEFVAQADKENADLVMGQINIYDGQKFFPHKYNHEFFSNAQIIEKISEFPELILCPTLSNKLIRKSLIDRLELCFSEHRYYGEDFHFCLALSRGARKIVLSDKTVVNFQDLGSDSNQVSLWNTNSKLRAENTLVSVLDMFNWMHVNGFDQKPYINLIRFHSVYRFPRALKIMAEGHSEDFYQYCEKVYYWITSEFGTTNIPSILTTKTLTRIPSILAIMAMSAIRDRQFEFALRLIKKQITSHDLIELARTKKCFCQKLNRVIEKAGLLGEVFSTQTKTDYSINTSQEEQQITSFSVSDRLKQLSYLQAIKRSGLFDEHYYCMRRTNLLAKAFPIVDYLLFGWVKHCNPSKDFDGQVYLDLRPDVRAAKINPLGHFVKHGIFEL